MAKMFSDTSYKGYLSYKYIYLLGIQTDKREGTLLTHTKSLYQKSVQQKKKQ